MLPEKRLLALTLIAEQKATRLLLALWWSWSFLWVVLDFESAVLPQVALQMVVSVQAQVLPD